MDFDLADHTHLLTVGGSRAYGMHTAESDVDVKGVAVPPLAYHLGYLHRFEQADKPGHLAAFSRLLTAEEQDAVASTKLEGVVFDLRKFVALAADANPNILDVLFCRDDETRFVDDIGRALRDARGLFLSQKAKHTFSGYAHSQLARIRSHRAWLLDPPKAEPTREAFGLPAGGSVLPRDQMGALDTLMARGVTADDLGLAPAALALLEAEKRYRAARTHWDQYQHWKASRNAARAELEARFGYDTKHAAHLVRLLRMGREILVDGKANVWRGGIDADELLAIRRGEWSYDRLVEWADAEDATLTTIYEARTSPLPREPDRKAIDALCVRLVSKALGDLTPYQHAANSWG